MDELRVRRRFPTDTSMKTPENPPFVGDRIFAGAYQKASENFMFCIWTYRALTKEEKVAAFSRWMTVRGKRKSIKGKTIHVIWDLEA